MNTPMNRFPKMKKGDFNESLIGGSEMKMKINLRENMPLMILLRFSDGKTYFSTGRQRINGAEH